MNDCAPSQAPVLPSHDECALEAFSVPSTCHLTVVSSVLGNAFSNIRARSLSTIFSFMSLITVSTSGDSKVRHRFAGRWKGSSSGPSLYGW